MNGKRLQANTITKITLLRFEINTNIAVNDDANKYKHFRVSGPLCGEFTGHR